MRKRAYIRDAIEAHLSVVFAVMTVSHYIVTQTGWSIEKFRSHRTALPRTVTVQAGNQTFTAVEPPHPTSPKS